MKNNRNDICKCGSGKKYKKCCLRKDEEERIKAIPTKPLTPKEKQEIQLKINYLMSMMNSGW